MQDRNYNPLNEGYSGSANTKRGYTGGSTGITSQAPKTLPSIQSAVIKTTSSQTASSGNEQQDS
jgi:hypothetical protein